MKNLRELRLKKKLTVEQLATKAGVHKNNIYFIESGTRTASVNMAQRLAPFLGCKWHELIDTERTKKEAGHGR